MNWKFEVTIKCIYDNEFISRCICLEYDATKVTWFEAWHKCIDDAIKALESNEVIVNIDSQNVIARCKK